MMNYNVALKRSLSEGGLQPSIILVFSTCFFKKYSSKIFDLDIENPLGGGTLAKFRSPL
jgi:hypothetical protein